MKKKQPIIKPEEELLTSVIDALNTHGRVKITGLGIFEIKKIKGRPGINPWTMEKLVVDDYTKITFRPTISLKRLVRKMKPWA